MSQQGSRLRVALKVRPLAAVDDVLKTLPIKLCEYALLYHILTLYAVQGKTRWRKLDGFRAGK